MGPKRRDLKRQVVKVFDQAGRKELNYKQVCSRLHITSKEEKNTIIQIMGALALEGRIEQVARGKFRNKQQVSSLTGTVDMNYKGAAYVVPETGEGDDVFISPKNLNHALDGDVVRVITFARRKNKKLEGEIVEILERARTEFVGTIEISPNFAFLVPDHKKMLVDLYIPLEKIKGAKHGQKAIGRITDWPEHASSPFGEVVEVLGNPGEHETEIHAILAEYGLPYRFPKEVEHVADKISTEITDEEVSKRRDMRGVPTFTIDPVDAKDFDDALSVQPIGDDLFEIGIHIADVSHYVQEGDMIDKEAVERATSIYLVDRVVPMLPEILSNQVCSLRPDEDKLCFSAIFQMNSNGVVKKEWFGRTVIRSQRRFTYEEAQKVIETGEGDMDQEILLLNKLAQKLRSDRLKKGAITFSSIEVRFRLDDQSRPMDVYFKESKDSNKLIEEFMLLANRKVAEFVGRKADGTPTHKTFVYRVHDEPNPLKIAEFNNFIKQFGYRLHMNNRETVTSSLNQVLEDVQGTQEENMVEQLAIRTMAKAEYTTENIGHYGLAFDYYTHFTSPIRRYPDVMVHRLLQHYLDGGKAPKVDRYESLSEHSSEMERLAANAERASIKYMQVVYMSEHLEEPYLGVISGVTQWGIFVEIVENKCEGMVRLSDIDDDVYTFDEANFCIIGSYTGKIYQLGDKVMVKVKKADINSKQIDFELLSN
jgi:ribonuclease R